MFPKKEKSPNVKKKTLITETCMVCSNKPKIYLGADRVPLCGVHQRQLRGNPHDPMFGLQRLSRREIRQAFGFLILEA